MTNSTTTRFSSLVIALLLSFGFLAAPVMGQSNVKLNINHHLAGVDFAYFTTAENNMGNSFDVKRLEYYVSEIVLVHDGGMETTVDDFFILVESSEDLTHDLGNYVISDIEGLRFNIGVEPDFNHTDPATYPADHPLSPQLPSMHWGWASGYRFVAIEGKCGATMTEAYEIHALGDVNYFEVDLDLGATVDGGDLVIDVYADYTKAFEGINVASGLIEHSEINEAADLLANFRDNVFSATAPPPVSGLNPIFQDVEISLYPNPSVDGLVLLSYETPTSIGQQELVISSINGQEVLRQSLSTGLVQTSLQLEKAGTYLVTIYADGQIAYSGQLLISK